MSMIYITGQVAGVVNEDPRYWGAHYALYLSPIPNDDGANLWAAPRSLPRSWIFMDGITNNALVSGIVDSAKLLQIQQRLRLSYANRGASSRALSGIGGQSATRPCLRSFNGARVFDSDIRAASRTAAFIGVPNPIQFWGLYATPEWDWFLTKPYLASLSVPVWSLSGYFWPFNEPGPAVPPG